MPFVSTIITLLYFALPSQDSGAHLLNIAAYKLIGIQLKLMLSVPSCVVGQQKVLAAAQLELRARQKY